MKKINRSSGFSLIELLVGMVITGIIIMGITSLTFLLFSSNVRIKQLDLLEQTKYDIQHEISNSVRWAAAVEISPIGDGFTVRSTDGETIVYQFQNKQLLKNSISMIPADVIVTDMIVTNNSVSPDLVSLDIRLALAQKSFATVQNSAHIVVSQRQLDIGQ